MGESPEGQQDRKLDVRPFTDYPSGASIKRKKLAGQLRDAVGYRILQASRGLPDDAGARVVESRIKERFPGEFVEWTAVTVSEAARHREIRRVLGSDERSMGRGSSVQVHSREIAEQFCLRPETFIEGPRSIGPAVTTAQHDYARSHLEAYATIRKARALFQRASVLARKTSDELERELIRRVRGILEKLYPEVVPYSSSWPGPTPEEFTMPEEILRDTRLELEGSADGPSHLGPVVKERQQDLRWRVSRAGVTTYAMVAQEWRCHVDELNGALVKLVRDPDLRRQLNQLRGERMRAGALRDGCISAIEDQGTRIRHGGFVAGKCRLGY